MSRGTMMTASQHAANLESVIITSALGRRTFRAPDLHAENTAIITLADEMARSPGDILQKVAETVLRICHAQSAGISLLEKAGNAFYWPAIAGDWQTFIGSGTPRDFGPCGTVLDRNTILLFSHPERHFDYLAQASPSIEEGLLAPFYVEGHAVGTIWAITHDPGRQFDSEDARVLESMSKFASSAYTTLADIGAIKPVWS